MQVKTALEVASALIPVQEIVCRVYKITLEQLHEKTRMPKISEPRQISMCIGAKIIHLSTLSLGRHYDVTHSNVCHANKKTWNLYLFDRSFRSRINYIAEIMGFNPDQLRPRDPEPHLFVIKIKRGRKKSV